eukprot:479688-Pleurochrysis_carterae.AAC.7
MLQYQRASGQPPWIWRYGGKYYKNKELKWWVSSATVVDARCAGGDLSPRPPRRLHGPRRCAHHPILLYH